MGEGGMAKRFLLLYGSQTGQAEAIAERVRDLACERGLKPDLHCISQSEKKFDITKEPVVVVVVSTTGEGEPPDTVSKFWRKLKKKTLSKTHLSGMHYGLLGLGDTNYTNFCNMGKNLHRRLKELGATPFVEPGWADDGTGLEIVVEPWIESLWNPLEHTLQTVHQPTPTANIQEDSMTHETHSPSAPHDLAVTTTNNRGTAVGESAGNTDPANNTRTCSSVEAVRAQQEPASTDLSTVTCSTVESNSSVVATMIDEVPSFAPSPLLNDSVSDLERRLRHRGSDMLKDTPLSLPTVPPGFLSVKFEEPSSLSSEVEFRYHDIEYVYGQVGGVTMATIVGCRQLTSEGALRKTIEVELHIENGEFSYTPGDAVSFICPNPPNEVDLILNRLGLMSCADHMMHLEISSTPGSTNRRNPVLPRHIPIPCSTRQYFTRCADFRATPKKVLLKYLSNCCHSDAEKRRLEELSSRTCATEYNDVILGQHADLLDVLFAFPSCQPSLDRLVQFIPKLKPRFYSIASSPLTSPRRLTITLSILHLPRRGWWVEGETGNKRKGLASGFFDSAAQKIRHGAKVKVPIVPRGANKFHLPDDPAVPVIMIGPGTGVAPFIGFLEHRRNQYRNGTAAIGKAWLFFGCRHPDLDHIYKSELETFLADRTLTSLTVCFSRLEEQRRSEGEGKYVQDGMKKHSVELAKWVIEDKACVYVCGDAKGMAKDVEAMWVSILSDYLKKMDLKEGVPCGEEEEGGEQGEGGERGEGREEREKFQEGGQEGEKRGQKMVEELKDTMRYLVDAWTS